MQLQMVIYETLDSVKKKEKEHNALSPTTCAVQLKCFSPRMDFFGHSRDRKSNIGKNYVKNLAGLENHQDWW